MRILLPYLMLYKPHTWMLILGIVLSIITILSSIGQLGLSGWLLSASGLAGIFGLYNFNYILPAVSIRAISIVRIAGRYFQRVLTHDTTFRVLQNLRVYIFSRLLPLSPSSIRHFRQGDLLNRLVADVDTLDHLYLNVFLPLAGTSVVILVITLGMSMLDVILSLTLGSMILLTFISVSPFFYYAGKPIGKMLIRFRGEYRKQLVSWIHAQAELSIFGATQRYRAQLDKTEFQWQEVQCRESLLIALSKAIMTFVAVFALLIMLWLASNGVDSNQQSRAIISFFVFSTVAAFDALIPLTGAFRDLGQIITAASRITELTEYPHRVQFAQSYIPVPRRVSLHLQNITFSYEEHTYPALKNLTLNILEGEHVAVVGRTGCGKSTLLQLLTRAWDPHKGLITINGIPLSNFRELTLRRTISVLTQRVYLFSATLRENLLLASPKVDDACLKSVLEKVGLQKLYEVGGLDTWMGEGGRQLSGGELRRLGIARVLLHNAPLMLLDEPMEGLDAISEEQMFSLFNEVMKDKTVVMVTHRLYKLKDFDRIVVMDNGQIIEEGKNEHFLEKWKYYYRLK